MVIVEKYERVLAYLYPIAQSIPNRHKMVRDRFMDCILGIPDLLYDAGKSNQVSKIYQADRELAKLRFRMRFLVKLHSMSEHQLQTAQIQLSEVGAMIGSWIKKRENHHG
jgi:hypothetical protein